MKRKNVAGLVLMVAMGVIVVVSLSMVVDSAQALNPDHPSRAPAGVTEGVTIGTSIVRLSTLLDSSEWPADTNLVWLQNQSSGYVYWGVGVTAPASTGDMIRIPVDSIQPIPFSALRLANVWVAAQNGSSAAVVFPIY